MSKHVHSENKQKIVRLNKIIGHTESIKKMIEEDRECKEILTQISAVKSAINGLGKLVLKDHLNSCIIDALDDEDITKEDLLLELNESIDKLL
ncbi:MAG TPA: metal-sensing transcriptional repressor [Tissierellaceae bacterium]